MFSAEAEAETVAGHSRGTTIPPPALLAEVTGLDTERSTPPPGGTEEQGIMEEAALYIAPPADSALFYLLPPLGDEDRAGT